MNWGLTVNWLAPRRQLVQTASNEAIIAAYAFLPRGAALVVA